MSIIRDLLSFRRNAAAIEELRQQLAAKDAFIHAQNVDLLHSRKIFDRSSAAAQLGVWQCTLPDNTIEWTDVIYDMFDLPRGSAIERDYTVNCYVGDSLAELHRRRSAAIAARTGFAMDAEIVTPKGNRRFIRITATVECENDVPVRIFGIKQDITEEKIMQDRTRYLAEFDVMTGLANRAQFQTSLVEASQAYEALGTSCALILVDLDGFKKLNDTFGHAAGDECLKETARKLQQVCGEGTLLARIGGDEFAVIVNRANDEVAVYDLADDIVRILYRSVALNGMPLQIGASAGVAFMDSASPDDLFQQADMALYEAKAAGRNRFHVHRSSGRDDLQACSAA